MGLFAPLSIAYIIFAFVFQIGSVTFIALDKKCSYRLAWSIAILLTGPIGLVVYFIKGRQKQ